jgi:pantoate--beta-alanine ligase
MGWIMLQQVETIADLRAARNRLEGRVGLVPTMGALHDGHRSLIQAARQENDTVIATIFVNPTQFALGEDFATYPRDLERDIDELEDEGVDLVFTPTPDEMYPMGFQTVINVEVVSTGLEGEHRPGHFEGVSTVVAKLFNLTLPDRAYFGQKDAQQVVVIKQMVRDLNFPLEIVVCPIVREPDGLAMSSRNVYLNPEERQAALVLWNALCLAREMWTRGTRDAQAFRNRMRELIATEELARVDYISVADPETLRDVERIQGPVLVSLAVRIGRTRLIDNITLG